MMNDRPEEMPQPIGPPPEPPPRRGRRLSPAWTIRLIIWAVLIIVLVIIGFQNSREISVTLFAWTFHVRLVWALLIAAVLGYILGWLRPRFRPRRAAIGPA